MQKLIQVQKNLLLKCIYNNFDEMVSFWWNENRGVISEADIKKATSKDSMTSLINNKDLTLKSENEKAFIKRYIGLLWWWNGIQESDVSQLLFSEKLALSKIVKLLKSTGRYEKVRWKLIWQSKDELDMLNDYLWLRGEKQSGSESDRKELLQETKTNWAKPLKRWSDWIEPSVWNDFQERTTRETQSKMRWTFSWEINRWEYFSNNPKVKWAIDNFLRGKTKVELQQTYEILDKMMKRNGWKIIFVVNDRDIKSYLKTKWYTFQTLTTSEEALIVYQTIRDSLATQWQMWNQEKQWKVWKQEKQWNMSEEQKIEMFFDFDGDWKLEWNNREMEHLYQTIHALHLKWQDWFWNLIQNLWLWTKAQLFQDMWENIVDARARFMRAYNASKESWYNITELVKPWKTQQVAREMLWKKQEIEDQVTAEVDYYLLENVDWRREFMQMSPQQKTKFKRELKTQILTWINANYVNWAFWVWTSLNIRTLTKDLLDTIKIQLNEGGGIWISVSKALFNSFLWKYGTSITLGMSNALIPMMSISQSSKYGTSVSVWVWSWLQPTFWASQSVWGYINNPEELFQMTTKTKIRWTVWATFGPAASMKGVSISKVNEQTRSWIEQMTSKLSKMLDDVMLKIMKWETKYSNKVKEQQVYEQVKSAFDNQTNWLSIEEKKWMSEIFKQWYVSAYRNELYKNAQGWKLTSVWVSIISIAWFYNLPVITLWWEYIKVKDKELNRDNDRQERMTHTSLSLDSIGASHREYNGNRVLQIPKSYKEQLLRWWKWELQVSVGKNSQVQIQEINGYLLIWWGTKSIDIMEHTENGKLNRTLVIDWWEKDVEWRYITTNSRNKITKSIQSAWWMVESSLEWLKIQDQERVEKISRILSVLIDHKAITEVEWMSKLQKSIHGYKISKKPSLDEVWQQYIAVINYEWKSKSFWNYAKRKHVWAEQLNSLREQSRSISSEADKIYVLQAFAMSLTTRWTIERTGWTVEWGTYELKGNKSINQYNKKGNRDKFFDELMWWKFPSLKGEMRNARNIWNEKNGNKTNYQTTSMNWLAFSWTEIWNRWTVTPLTGWYELIWAWSDAMVPMNINKKQKNELIANIPEYMIQWYGEQLRNMWIDVWNSSKTIKEYLKRDDVQLDAFFAKNAQCINDCIVIKFKTKWQEITIGTWSSATLDIQQNSAIKIWLTASVWELEKRRKEKWEKEKWEKEKWEKEKWEKEKWEKEKWEKEKWEKEKSDKEKWEKEKTEKEKWEKEKSEKEHWEKEKSEKEHWEKEKSEKEHWEKEKSEKEHWEKEKSEKEHWEKEKSEKEHWEKEKSEKEHWEKEKSEKEHWEKEHWEKEHWEKEHWEKEHWEKEHWDKEHWEKEHWEKEHWEKEHWDKEPWDEWTDPWDTWTEETPSENDDGWATPFEWEI